jgi:membrane protein DedA with SNARE-associated domain
MMLASAGGTAPATTLGVPLAFVLLLGTESGAPVPLPADLLMLAIGAAVSGGQLPLWVAVLGLELVAVIGTATLLLAARGPARATIARLGPRVGLGAQRMDRASAMLERRGRSALAIGRATPGLRTVTVVAAAAAAIPPRRALPLLLIGSTVFLQGHFLLGYALGPAVRAVLSRTGGPLLIAAAAAVLVTLAVVLARRRRGTGTAWAEGCCPVCLAAASFQK